MGIESNSVQPVPLLREVAIKHNLNSWICHKLFNLLNLTAFRLAMRRVFHILALYLLYTNSIFALYQVLDSLQIILLDYCQGITLRLQHSLYTYLYDIKKKLIAFFL